MARRYQGGPVNPDDPQGSRDLLLDQIDQPAGGPTVGLPPQNLEWQTSTPRNALLEQMDGPPVNFDDGPGASMHTPTPQPRMTDATAGAQPTPDQANQDILTSVDDATLGGYTDQNSTPDWWKLVQAEQAKRKTAAAGATGAPAGLSATRQRIWDNFHSAQNKNPIRDPNETDYQYWEGKYGTAGADPTYFDQRMFDQEGQGSNAGHTGAGPTTRSQPGASHANRVDVQLTGPVSDAIAYLQQEAQRIGLAPLTPAQLQQYAQAVGWRDGQPVTGAMVNQALDLMEQGTDGHAHQIPVPTPTMTTTPTHSPGGDDWLAKLLAQLHLGEGTAPPSPAGGRL